MSRAGAMSARPTVPVHTGQVTSDGHPGAVPGGRPSARQTGPVPAQRDATLTPRHHQAIDLLVAGRDQRDVARVLEVDRTTVWRWGRMPEFARALAAAEDDAHRAHARTLGNAARAATLYLASVMADDKAPIGVKVQAGTVLLSKWAQLQPAHVRAAVAMSLTSSPPDVDTTHALAELTEMLDLVADNRERSSPRAIRGVLDVAEAPANGNGNGGSP